MIPQDHDAKLNFFQTVMKDISYSTNNIQDQIVHQRIKEQFLASF